jgi:hypothetical protein
MMREDADVCDLLDNAYRIAASKTALLDIRPTRSSSGCMSELAIGHASMAITWKAAFGGSGCCA